jgi:hypothetical protein
MLPRVRRRIADRQCPIDDLDGARFTQLAAPPVFVVGVPRSGTTWVGDIFAAHPLVSYVHESALVSHGLAHLFADLHFPGEYSGLGFTISRAELIALTAELARRIWSRKIQPQHRFFVEKSPKHLLHMPLIREMVPGAKFILLVRDGRDVCVSMRSASNSWAPEWKGEMGRNMAELAKSWNLWMRTGLRDAAMISDDVLLVRYEEVHAEPFRAYRRLFDFVGVPYDEAQLQAVFARTDFKRNHKGGENEFRRQGKVGNWRRRFSPMDTLQFKREAGDLLIDLGYAGNHRWHANYAASLGSSVRRRLSGR